MIIAYQMWQVFEEWELANAKVLTDYEKDMFQWMAIFAASQDNSVYADVAPSEVNGFIDGVIGKGVLKHG